MEPRLRTLVKEKDERIDILKQVYCETHRYGEARLPPGLVMALIDVESRFDRWAVSSAGAVGLMQVMPFWPEKLGLHRYELVHVAPNIRMGCAILRFYLTYEHNDVRRALARYNGSIGHRDYPDLVHRALDALGRRGRSGLPEAHWHRTLGTRPAEARARARRLCQAPSWRCRRRWT